MRSGSVQSVRGDRVILALDGQLDSVAGRVAEDLGDPRGEDDLAAAGLPLEPRRGVDDVTDGREVPNAAIPDVADESLAEVEPDPDLGEGAVRGAVADGQEQLARV